MANVTNLKQGSSGSDVKKLQNELIKAGYDVGGTGADGVFGKNTDAAVKQYQKDNGLAVDGIAGKNTLGSLYGTSSANTAGTTATGGDKKAKDTTGKDVPTTKTDTSIGEPAPPVTPVTSPGGFTYGDFYYDPYDPMADAQISQAWNILQQTGANKPGDWVDPYLDKYTGYLNQYENRDPFSYDFNSDALYNQYKDQYIQQGQLAMMDTMGQAAAMTGGYGNSYAQTVGQQAYNQQLSQLNEIMPELYSMAYDKYNQEGQELLNMYGLYKGLSTEDYGRHQDTVSNWYREMDRLTTDYNNLYNQGWENYLLGYNTAQNEYNTSRSEAFTADQNAKNQAWQEIEAEKDRQHQSAENEKSRSFTARENEKERAAVAAKAAATSPYSTLNTEDTMTWIKTFEGAKDLAALERHTTALQGIIGPEAAAIWFDTYAGKFKDDEEDKIPLPIQKGGGGGSGGVWMVEAW
jgi:peptidoglycan hydrolase-like protein with peptidoglycan-binding domain